MSTPSAAITPERILQFAWGFAPTLTLEAAIRHRVFDVLDEGPKTLPETAAATGASERGLLSIMNVLAGLGFLAKDTEARYSLTPESATFLVSTKPAFQGALFRHASVQLIPAWLHLNEVVATGRPATAVNQEKTGAEFFIDLVADIFPLSYPAATALGQHLAFGESGDPVSVLDLAAGSAVWSIALAQSSPRVKATAVDWPEVLPATRKMTERFGLADRFTFVGGDLAEANFGTGHTVATLGHILHSEGEERSRALLKRTFEALAPGGVIVVAEFLVNEERTGPVGSLIFSVNMVVNTDHGNTYSFGEIGGWLTEAGFTDARLLEAPGPSPLILATKPA